jgi:LysR family glycine cleavage system transcriptional activator
MQKQSLPSLNALRAFEAAARTASFTKAGEELGVSQSAISKQVALLEEQLGQELFYRQHRQIELTEAGQRVAQSMAGALGVLRKGLLSQEPKTPHQILLDCDADFAQLWLLPRLHRFETANTGMRVSIKSTVGLNTPPAEDFELAIVWGRGDWSNCNMSPLMTNRVFPLSAPGAFDCPDNAAEPAKITSDMLIHDRTNYWWSAFRAITKEASFDPSLGRIYNQTVLCLDAAARGNGITIGDEISSREYVSSGRLVRPFKQVLPSLDAYYVVYPSDRSLSNEAFELISWLQAETLEHQEWWNAYWNEARH